MSRADKADRKARLESLTAAAFNTQSPELQNLIAYHLRDAVVKEPLEKIRLTIEAYYMAAGTSEGASILSQEQQIQLDRIYLTCLSLRATNAGDQFISIPWAFPQDPLSYAAYIEPWHRGLADGISFRYSNDAKRLEKETAIVGLPQWHAFFKKTTELDLSPTSLMQLKTAFVAYSMRFLMSLYAKLGMMYAKSLRWESSSQSHAEGDED